MQKGDKVRIKENAHLLNRSLRGLPEEGVVTRVEAVVVFVGSGEKRINTVYLDEVEDE